jgi:serine/threonine-protein kinase
MMLGQVVKVLHRAHVLGIVHRDIKPDNIFINEDSDYELFVKVLDFGIAKQNRIGAAQVTHTGVVVGTPEFMSPEQAVGSKDLDYRSDLFSLAVVAFFALTGQLPFDSESEEPLWLAMSQQRHRRARTYVPELPEAIDTWFSRALQPRPQDRFQSAKTMADAFAMVVDPEQGNQIVDELSASDGRPLPGRPRDDEDSQPAMYELIGPDSTDEYGSDATVQMDASDHHAAEGTEIEPPTVRRYPLKAFGAALSPQLVSAVAAGVYNAGVYGAYNQVVSKTLVDDSLSDDAPSARPFDPVTRTTPMSRPEGWPTRVATPTSRVPIALATVGALAVIAAMVVMAWLHLG